MIFSIESVPDKRLMEMFALSAKCREEAEEELSRYRDRLIYLYGEDADRNGKRYDEVGGCFWYQSLLNTFKETEERCRIELTKRGLKVF